MENVVETKDFKIDYEMKDNLVFLHIFFFSWGPATVRAIRQSIEDVKQRFLSEGHDVVFAVTDEEKVVRFWNMIDTCYQVEQLKDGSYLGCWLTEEI